MFKVYIFIPVIVVAFSLFIFSIKTKINFLKLGKKEDKRKGRILKRLSNVLTIAFGQSKLLRDKPAGILHFFIFWGFILFIFAVLETILQGFNPSFSFKFLGVLYTFFLYIEDYFGLLVILSVLFALLRRFIIRIPRLEVDKSGKKDAAFILIMILCVVVFMFFQNAAHSVIMSENFARPLSGKIGASIFNADSARVGFEVFWWLHILTIFTFLNYLPYSKHFHVITSIPNTYLANLDPERNTIKKVNLEDENQEQYGVKDFNDLSWKQLLDGYTCTECGRCSQSCPANYSGKTLSPRSIIMNIRERTLEAAPALLKPDANFIIDEKPLLRGYISEKELWQCTTCMACVQECPVMIEHVDSIVDMRRYLVLTESEFPDELNVVFRNLETNCTPWAFNQTDRASWAEGLEIKTMAEDESSEYLFWVGCAGSFDERYKRVSQAFAKLMQMAGVDFRILGTEEKCNGDTARRLGNEYLAQTLMQANIETLTKYNVKKIVTACPHCFHSLKNEYKQFGVEFEVKHHSQLLKELIEDGKLPISNKNATLNSVTYHDSCYIGRYNKIFNAPRYILEAAGNTVLETKRNKDKGFCCGAGGGRMFLEDVEGRRINEVRVEELLETKSATISSACPFCMTMLNDGVKHFDKTDNVNVKDIAEILFEYLTNNK